VIERWHYLIVSLGTEGWSVLVNTSNDVPVVGMGDATIRWAGDNGWELISVVPVQAGTAVDGSPKHAMRYYFKRPNSAAPVA